MVAENGGVGAGESGVTGDRLGWLRLAAQALTPATAAAGPVDAARAVVGVQAQDVRAAALALRSRVPGLRRADVDGSPLVRTWTLRGTVHLHDPADLPWLDAVLGPRNRARFEEAMRRRGDYEVASWLLGDLVELLAAFDTTMLGYRRREPLVAAAHDRRVLPGGGMLRPVVLVDGRAAATWGVPVRAGRPAVTIEWFGDPAPSAALDAEMRRVEAFLAPVH